MRLIQLVLQIIRGDMKKNGRREAFRDGIWLGSLVTLMIVCFIQDWIGLDGYIAHLEGNWINIPWWVWPPFVVLMTVAIFYLCDKYNTLDKEEYCGQDSEKKEEG